jgi:Flp pilus assembly protein TadG
MTSVDLRPVLAVRRGRARLRRAGSDERGAVLVIVAMMMFVMLAMAALAIDIGSFYQAQRQAQAAADAGALAGSDVLATDTTGAVTSVASNMASTNYPGASIVTEPTPTSVKVKVTAYTPSLFNQFFGFPPVQVSASATASPSITPCATPGGANTCYAIFASDLNCTPGYGVTFNGAGDTITGAVHSNGSINLVGRNQTLNGPTTYGQPAPPCTINQQSTGDTFPGGTTSQAPFPPGSWPANYYLTPFTPCTPGSTCSGACATSTTPCPTADQTPSYCTVASRSGITLLPAAANGVYCAVGSGTAADPSTYAGYIDLKDTNTAPVVSATMLAGNVECGVKDCAAQPFQTSYPLACAAGPNGQGATYAFTGTGQNENLTGAIFAPNGTILFNGKGSTANFLEATDVILQGQGFTGIGPVDSGPGATSGGASSSLIQ